MTPFEEKLLEKLSGIDNTLTVLVIIVFFWCISNC